MGGQDCTTIENIYLSRPPLHTVSTDVSMHPPKPVYEAEPTKCLKTISDRISRGSVVNKLSAVPFFQMTVLTACGMTVSCWL